MSDNSITGDSILIKSSGMEIDTSSLGSGTGFVVMVNPKTGNIHTLSGISDVTPSSAGNVSGSSDFQGSQVVNPHI